jgi:hypothetical protein
MPELYPCKLPGVLVNSNSYSPQALVDRNDLESGPPIFRLRSSDGWVNFDVAFSFSALEVQVFRSWFHGILVRGSKSFTIGLMIDGWNGEANTIDHECYFVDAPQYRQNKRRWSVSAKLLAVEDVEFDECDQESLINAFNGFEDLNNGIICMDQTITLLETLWAP